jgi:hypothetical protein
LGATAHRRSHPAAIATALMLCRRSGHTAEAFVVKLGSRVH